jgi:hypothetical protein
MLITAGHLILDDWIFDIDLAEPPILLGTNRSVIPGSRSGVVWFARRQRMHISSDFVWVSPVDVESLTVGERVDITDVFSRPIVGVADGLIVVDLEGELAFWSPTDGLVSLDLVGESDMVVAASGDLVIVASAFGRVQFLDIVSGEYVFSFDLLDIGASACLSPDGQHVIVIGRSGFKAVVGNTTAGEVLDLNQVSDFPIQLKHGIGWTTDDQLVFIAGNEDSKHLFGLDVRTGESFLVATLDGPDWRLAASGTMC